MRQNATNIVVLIYETYTHNKINIRTIRTKLQVSLDKKKFFFSFLKSENTIVYFMSVEWEHERAHMHNVCVARCC